MPLILPRRQHTAAGTRGLPNDCGVLGFILEGYSVDIVPIIVRHGPPDAVDFCLSICPR
jgi:hypothetical protein